MVVQKAILQSIADLKNKHGITVVFVAHDLAAHAEIDDRMAIMYAGKIVELGTVYDIFEDPIHPYTKLLVASIPSVKKKVVKGIPGLSPSPLNWPPGCRFHPRCPYAMPRCSREEPELTEISTGRFVACHLLR